MTKIKSIIASEILDSRGNPTVETKIELEDGALGIDSAPSGASTGIYEALELRDGDPARFDGLGVLKAVENVNQKIAPRLLGFEADKQENLDQEMIKIDGTENKSNLGANAILSVSLAACRAAANSQKMPLYKYIAQRLMAKSEDKFSIPAPMFNIINGGKHGAGNLDFQEFMIIISNNKPFHEALRAGDEIYFSLKKVLIHRNAIHSVGDEGGFAPNLFTNADALEILSEACLATPYKLGSDVFLGLDVAASSFFKNDSYSLKDKTMPLSASEMIDYYQQLISQYHLLSLEDPFYEDDWNSWINLTRSLGTGTIVIGDDLFATNLKRLKRGIENRAATAILVKPNQIGTLSETLEVIKMAQGAGWRTIISHRSGETNDSFIADMAVAVGADFVKFGAPVRGERITKYNRLLEIEKEIESSS